MTSHIPYGAYARKALLGVVQRVLKEAAHNGIPTPHHFYISFRTDHSQTIVPDFLRESYPDQMTVILQHQFWDLCVEEHGFSVVLSFNGVQEKLFIPFGALTTFSDPSVKFGLQFMPDFETEDTAPPESPEPPPASPDPERDGEGNVVRLESFRKK
ncbi:MAG: ClpXP protease specificity-enhancing factor SspB [Holosporales bacterium]|jgi:hypothetical protein|nr:ClpXP protease specificity-enhancing factor SspB [Holosporales bacterium]